jgi:hypothetical protein
VSGALALFRVDCREISPTAIENIEGRCDLFVTELVRASETKEVQRCVAVQGRKDQMPDLK